jgi:hypothetical protein
MLYFFFLIKPRTPEIKTAEALLPLPDVFPTS